MTGPCSPALCTMLPNLRTHFRALLILAAAAASGCALATTEIKVGGTGNALGTMRLMGLVYTQHHPDTRVQVLPSLGTSGAVKAVPKGAIDIGLSSRPLKEEEVKAGLNATEYARSPLVFAVPVKTRVTALSLAQLADIYAGRMSHWPDGGPVRPVLRQAGDDNTLAVRQMSPALDQALTIAEQRQGLPFATTDQETADKLESIPGALGVVALCLIQSEGRALRPLALDGVEPTLAHAQTGRYPYLKRFYVVTRAEPSAEVKRFLAFVQSPAGAAILARTGHVLP